MSENLKCDFTILDFFYFSKIFFFLIYGFLEKSRNYG